MSLATTKVYQLFAVLSLQERKNFIRFLRRHSKPKKLKIAAGFHFLCDHEKLIENGKITAIDWWNVVFPETAFQVAAMRKHQNALVNDLEGFFIDQKFQKEKDKYLARVREVEQYLLLLTALQERGLDRLFFSYLKRVEDLLAGLPDDHERFAMQFRMELLKINTLQKTEPFLPRNEFQAAQEALDHYYLINALKLEVANANQLRLHPKQKPLNHAMALSAIAATLPKHSLLAKLYQQIVTFQAEITASNLGELFQEIVASQSAIAPDSWRDLLYICLNFAIRAVNEGQGKYREIVLQVYLCLLHAGLLQKDIGSFKANFLNIVNLAFYRDPPIELAKYVQEQTTWLAQHEEFQNVAQFYRCLELFHQQEFSKAIDPLWKVWLLEGSRRVRYAAAILLLKCQYEASEYSALKSWGDDLGRMIAHDPVIDEGFRSSCRQFLKAILILSKIRFRGLTAMHKPKLKKLEATVQAETLMKSREWMLSKIHLLWKTQ